MGRRTANFVITGEADNRDAGKCFVITEMPASQGEEWAYRALCALARSGVELPEEFEGLGMAAIAALGFQMLAGIRFEEAKPLLEEMMACVQRVEDPQGSPVTRKLVENDTEEIHTRLKLRREVFNLHTGFLKAAMTSISTSGQAATEGSEII